MAESRAGLPCPRCMSLADDGLIRYETVQPLRGGALDAYRRDRRVRQCQDCAAAELLIVLGLMPNDEHRRRDVFLAARITIGNHRQESMRLPGVVIGLARDSLARVSIAGELEAHHAWLDDVRPGWQEDST